MFALHSEGTGTSPILLIGCDSEAPYLVGRLESALTCGKVFGREVAETFERKDSDDV
jgi:hypothetical protein